MYKYLIAALYISSNFMIASDNGKRNIYEVKDKVIVCREINDNYEECFSFDRTAIQELYELDQKLDAMAKSINSHGPLILGNYDTLEADFYNKKAKLITTNSHIQEKSPQNSNSKFMEIGSSLLTACKTKQELVRVYIAYNATINRIPILEKLELEQ